MRTRGKTRSRPWPPRSARVRDELGLPESSAFDALSARWSEIVGVEIAAHARLDSVRDGIATVTADGPIWATQLRYLETAIVEGAAVVAGAGVVLSIRGSRRHGPASGRSALSARCSGRVALAGRQQGPPKPLEFVIEERPNRTCGWYTGGTVKKCFDLRFCVRNSAPRVAIHLPCTTLRPPSA